MQRALNHTVKVAPELAKHGEHGFSPPRACNDRGCQQAELCLFSGKECHSFPADGALLPPPLTLTFASLFHACMVRRSSIRSWKSGRHMLWKQLCLSDPSALINPFSEHIPCEGHANPQACVKHSNQCTPLWDRNWLNIMLFENSEARPDGEWLSFSWLAQRYDWHDYKYMDMRQCKSSLRSDSGRQIISTLTDPSGQRRRCRTTHLELNALDPVSKATTYLHLQDASQVANLKSHAIWTLWCVPILHKKLKIS